MTKVSMHAVSAPVFVRNLNNLASMLAKAEQQAKAKGYDPAVLLSARLFGPINEATYTAASLIELLHTASLVHDDVVDDANERRGFFSINALWKNKIAVLVGDFLFSRSFELMVEDGSLKVLKILSHASAVSWSCARRDRDRRIGSPRPGPRRARLSVSSAHQDPTRQAGFRLRCRCFRCRTTGRR